MPERTAACRSRARRAPDMQRRSPKDAEEGTSRSATHRPKPSPPPNGAEAIVCSRWALFHTGTGHER